MPRMNPPNGPACSHSVIPVVFYIIGGIRVEFDLIIKNGSVIDGTGAPARPADVGITGDRIVAIDNLEAAQAAETIDATGRVVSPGFVDVHIHSETNLLDPEQSLPARRALAGRDDASGGAGWIRLGGVVA